MYIVYRHKLMAKSKDLVERILSDLRVCREDVVIVFDSEDYMSHKVPIWRKAGTYGQLHDIDPQSPPYLLDLAKNMQYRHLIWFSGRTCNDEREIVIPWRLVHEIRHFEQAECSVHLSMADTFLQETFREVAPAKCKASNFFPVEMDADLRAWNYVRTLLGTVVADSYVKNEAVSAENAMSFQIILNYGPGKSYDVIVGTLELLHEAEQLLAKAQGSQRRINLNAAREYIDLLEGVQMEAIGCLPRYVKATEKGGLVDEITKVRRDFIEELIEKP